MNLDQLFGLTQFTPSVYESVLQHIHALNDHSLLNANGGRFVRAFPPFYTDYDAAALAILQSDSDAYSAFPRLSLLSKAHGGTVPPMIDQIATAERSRALLGTIELINTSRKGMSPLSATRIMNQNLSQFHRDVQEQEHIASSLHVKRLITWLHKWCTARGATFSLRPPIAMPSSSQEALRHTSPLSGIHMPQLYYSAAHEKIMEQLRVLGWDVIHDILPEDEDVARSIHNLHEWEFWNDRAAYAVIRFSDESEIALTPSVIIPPLYAEVRATLPYFIHEPFLTPIGDVIHGVEFTSSIPSIDPTSYKLDTWLPGQALAAIAYAVTLEAATLRLGRGHHKPTWTQAPLNAALCSHMTHWIAHLLKLAEATNV